MPITQCGTVLQFNCEADGVTPVEGVTVGTITVPADAEIVVAGVAGFQANTNYFSEGSVTFTKGGTDTAMVSATLEGDAITDAFMCAMFYQVAPDTGAGKSLKWSWVGEATATNAPIISLTFWKGINTASPVRDAGGGQNSGYPFTTSSLTALSGDLIVACIAAYTVMEGEADAWTNLTLLAQLTQYGYADGAWATGSPSGDTTVAYTSSGEFQDGGICAIVLKPAEETLIGKTAILPMHYNG